MQRLRSQVKPQDCCLFTPQTKTTGHWIVTPRAVMCTYLGTRKRYFELFAHEKQICPQKTGAGMFVATLFITAPKCNQPRSVSSPTRATNRLRHVHTQEPPPGTTRKAEVWHTQHRGRAAGSASGEHQRCPRAVGEGRAGAWDLQAVTAVQKTDQQGPAAQHGELHSVSCHKPQWKRM